jgi:glycine cleavage system transcriptional repressor
MPQFALSAIGRDRPGIVAEVTRALLGHSLNITDSQMAVLSGRFTMMLVVTAPEGTDLELVGEELARTRERLSLDALSFSPLGEAGAAAAPAPSHIVTVYGVDHPGIVHAVSARLAAREVNVTDLETRLVGEGGQAGLYAMVLEVALPAGMEEEALRAMLDEVGAEQGVDVAVRPLETDVM